MITERPSSSRLAPSDETGLWLLACYGSALFLAVVTAAVAWVLLAVLFVSAVEMLMMELFAETVQATAPSFGNLLVFCILPYGSAAIVAGGLTLLPVRWMLPMARPGILVTLLILLDLLVLVPLSLPDLLERGIDHFSAGGMAIPIGHVIGLVVMLLALPACQNDQTGTL